MPGVTLPLSELLPLPPGKGWGLLSGAEPRGRGCSCWGWRTDVRRGARGLDPEHHPWDAQLIACSNPNSPDIATSPPARMARCGHTDRVALARGALGSWHPLGGSPHPLPCPEQKAPRARGLPKGFPPGSHSSPEMSVTPRMAAGLPHLQPDPPTLPPQTLSGAEGLILARAGQTPPHGFLLLPLGLVPESLIAPLCLETGRLISASLAQLVWLLSAPK